jgi:hypothetical protein
MSVCFSIMPPVLPDVPKSSAKKNEEETEDGPDPLRISTLPITKKIPIPVITIDDSSPESFTPPAYYPEPDNYEPLSPACFEIHSSNFQETANEEDFITIDEVATSESEDDEIIAVEKDDDIFAPKNPVDEDIFDLELD